MELFTIDPNDSNRRLSLIEHYESFIWTDRYSAFGDLTMVVEPTPAIVSRLVPGVQIGFTESDRIMIVKSALRETAKNKTKKLTVKATSYEAKLLDRVAKKALSAATWNLTGTMGVIIKTMVDDICHAGTGISSSDILPNISTTDLTGLVAVKSVKIKDVNTLYDQVKKFCDAYGLGFRITVTPGVVTRKFEVYVGTDRTTVNGGIIFSDVLDNLSNTSYLIAEDNYKNVAYVLAPNGSRIVTATGASGVAGMQRNVLFVDASDITTAAGATLQAELLERGNQELSEHKKTALFDGTVNPDVGYRYGRDYFMGDKVLYRGDDKVRQTVIVTEHIWSADQTGFKSYPTLTTIGGV